MADPAAHKIEDLAAGRQPFAMKPHDIGDRNIVDVLHKTWLAVEQIVGRFVSTDECLGFEHRLPFQESCRRIRRAPWCHAPKHPEGLFVVSRDCGRYSRSP
jgi:hypothetical protein